MLKLVEKEILFVQVCLAGVAHGDGQLLVAWGAVDADAAHHVGDALLGGGSPGQGPGLGLGVGEHAVVVVLLGGHRVHVMVGLPNEVHNIAWIICVSVLRHRLSITQSIILSASHLEQHTAHSRSSRRSTPRRDWRPGWRRWRKLEKVAKTPFRFSIFVWLLPKTIRAVFIIIVLWWQKNKRLIS